MNYSVPCTNPTLHKLQPQGYFGAVLEKNIQRWALSALSQNPGIVGHLLHAPHRLPAPGPHERPLVPWYNEFPGKLLTGMAFAYQAAPSPGLLAAGDELAAALSAAQGPDGYLGVYDKENRFGGDGENWDLWGHYHSAYGLLCWYHATGGVNTPALETARQALDCVYNQFSGGGRSYDSAQNQTMNLAVSHGFALFYQQTGDPKYLDAALQIVDQEWPLSGDWKGFALRGGEFWQSPLPRWEALHTILTLGTLYEITGEKKYFQALTAIWKSIRKTDRHNTGGFSSGEQAQGTPFATGAIETCCTVAWMALTTEYLRLSKDPLAADELELSLLNGLLGAMMPDGRAVSYNTPMCGESRDPSQVEIGFQHNRFSPDFNCCQANALRGLAQVSQWAAMTAGGKVYVNYYGPCRMELETPKGRRFTLAQHTAYPARGQVLLTLEEMEEEPFPLLLRIPLWAVGTAVSVNGQALPGTVPGRYFTLSRSWRAGDQIKLDLGMAVHAWPGGESFLGAASLYYGPVLMTAPEPAVLNFSYIQAKAAAVEDLSSSGQGWLRFTLPEGCGPAVLRDFATGSHQGGYTSWLRFQDSGRLPGASAGHPDWCGG